MNLAFASSKGGVGKSTACASIAALLADRGDRVIILDLDDNQTLTRWSKSANIENLDVLHVDPANFSDIYRSDAVKGGGYDHILIDLAGAKDDKAFVHAMGRAHLVIIPAQHSEPDLREAIVVIKYLNEIQETFDRTIPYRVLFNSVRPLGSKVDRFIMDQAAEKGVKRFDTMWIDRVAYREMFLNGVPPHKREPGKGAGLEVAAVLDEITQTLADTTQLKKVG
ncbi:MAG: ParA family protein [Pseudomonadota bacterium]